jgi:ABC-type amino acid transport substrate-binding protein
MLHKLKTGQYTAIISDYGQVGQRVQDDKTCRLKLLPDDLGKTEKGFAFRVNFTQDHGNLVERINSALLAFNEEGVATVAFLSSPNPIHNL